MSSELELWPGKIVGEARAAGLSSTQVKEIIKKSYASVSVDDPYGSTPKSVTALARTKSRPK